MLLTLGSTWADEPYLTRPSSKMQESGGAGLAGGHEPMLADAGPDLRRPLQRNNERDKLPLYGVLAPGEDPRLDVAGRALQRFTSAVLRTQTRCFAVVFLSS